MRERHGCGSCGEAGCCELSECGYKWMIDRMAMLLVRLRQWDMMDATADGPYWRSEIDAALTRIKAVEAEAGSSGASPR